MRFSLTLVLSIALVAFGCGDDNDTTGGTGGGGGGSAACLDDVCPCTEAGIRAAIAEGGGPFTFDCDGPQTVVTEAEIIIENDVILDGERNLTVDGAQDHRVVSVQEGVHAELRRLTVTHGWATPYGTPPPDGEPWPECGGGIANDGTLVIDQVVISDNFAAWSLGEAAGGGGICNEGEMSVRNSTVASNDTEHGGGGGIRNGCLATMVVVDSVISENYGQADVMGGLIGGGIENCGRLTILSSTVSGNEAVGQSEGLGGGIASTGWLSVTNSSIVGNTADRVGAIAVATEGDDPAHVEIANTLVEGDCDMRAYQTADTDSMSNAYNIESPGDTCGFDQPTDQVNVSADDLKLGELADNGGQTMTHALGEGSVAIDQIPVADCVHPDGAHLTTDQRGLPRDSLCDVGAFEVQP